MARRFGGRYSPGENAAPAGGAPRAQTPPPEHRPDPVGLRANLMFVPPVALAVRSVGDGAVTMAGLLGAAAALALGAWLLREGLRAEAAFQERKVARRPALPRKILAAVLAATGTGVATAVSGAPLVAAAIYAALAGGLHLAAFGLDPLADKGTEGIDTFQQDRVARAVDEAEAHLKAMSEAILRARDRGLERRVAEFSHVARGLFRRVEEDPRDLTAVRRYLGVYLLGARDATVKFADLYSRSSDPDARAQYEALLEDLGQNFASRTEKMLIDDRSDMEIEIKVLRDRLGREGVRTE